MRSNEKTAEGDTERERQAYSTTYPQLHNICTQTETLEKRKEEEEEEVKEEDGKVGKEERKTKPQSQLPYD